MKERTEGERLQGELIVQQAKRPNQTEAHSKAGERVDRVDRRQFTNKTSKDFAVFTAGYYWKGILTALSKEDKGYAMDKGKSSSTLFNEEKETEHLSASGIPKKEFSPERRTEKVSANLAIDNYHDKVVFIKGYRRLHPSIEKPSSLRKEGEGIQSGSGDIINLRPDKETKRATESPKSPAEEVQSPELPRQSQGLGAKKPRLEAQSESLPDYDQSPVTEVKSESINDKPIIFADEQAKFAWEISQAVDRIVATLPPEERKLRLRPITFSSGHRRKGIHAIFYTGTVIGTDQRNVLLVPERTLKVLNALDVQYRIVQDK